MAEAQETVAKTVSIDDLIQKAVTENHLNYHKFYQTLKCESADFSHLKDQSDVLDANGPNGKENSWGIVQIWLDAGGHPEVTKEEATDPEWAVAWAGKEFARNPYQWSCYRKYQKTGW